MVRAKTFSDHLLEWFDQHGRKDLPWQHPRSPYFVWLSEIMLQQTQVATVIPYFEKFTHYFPNILSLAKATEDEVLALWAGLGYYSRARNLHKAAQSVVESFAGKFPEDIESLQALPGVGRSTAGAILAQAFEKFGVILDGNVRRVLSRYYTENDEKKLWIYAEKNTPKKRLADYSQAIMDLGATLCARTKPRCPDCPLQKTCRAYQSASVEEYPAKKIKKSVPTKERFFLIQQNEKGEILMERQASPGIWGGLWSLPSAEAVSSTRVLEYYEAFTHTFTHFKLHLKPVVIKHEPTLRASESLPQRWVSEAELWTMGLPAPIKKILKKRMEVARV